MKEPYITHKRALNSPKRDLLMHLLRSGMRKGPESSVTEPYFTPEIDLLTLASLCQKSPASRIARIKEPHINPKRDQMTRLLPSGSVHGGSVRGAGSVADGDDDERSVGSGRRSARSFASTRSSASDRYGDRSFFFVFFD